LHGLIGGPELTRANRKQEFFCVNQRPVRSPMVYRALDTAYGGFLLSREYPVVILNLSLPPDTIDVNVHPQKNEIRFQDEKPVFDYLHGVIRDRLKGADFSPRQSGPAAIGGQNGHPNGFSFAASPMVAEGTLPLAKSDVADFRFQPTGAKPMFSANPFSYQQQLGQNAYVSSANYDHDVLSIEPGQELNIIGQTLNSYILVEAGNNLWLIDQHAAHERIIYSGLLESAAAQTGPAQILALPLTLELSVRDMDLIENNPDMFADLGFQLEPLGPTTLAIRSAPSLISGSEDEVIAEILEVMQENGPVNLKEKALALMACKKAIKAGERLTFNEMERIIIDLLGSRDYKNCPHGRPTMIRLSRRDLDRMFKR